MEIETSQEIGQYMESNRLKEWVAVDNHLKIIKEIGRLCVGKPSRYDSEQIEKIRKLCLKQIDTLSNEKECNNCEDGSDEVPDCVIDGACSQSNENKKEGK